MTHALKSAVATAALVLALAACASAPDPSPRLLAAEASLQAAKANPATFETGRAPLEQAEAALRQARESFMKREDDAYTHSIRMGEGYISLAESRGGQLEANRRIAALNTQRAEVVSAARLRDVANAEAATDRAQAATATAQAATATARAAEAGAEARATQSATVAAAAVADSAAARKDQLAAEAKSEAMRIELAGYEQQKTALGVTLILRDLQFASSSAVLSAGAQGRLAPLAAYMAKQPDARIQIAGHTDSQGSDASNMELSARRAQSVGAYLNSTGVSLNRINSVGMGEAAPTSSNDTAAGRAINRRVEVTILD
jgi:outer membrane protein OmpA-like peptidoglycan-associated protein